MKDSAPIAKIDWHPWGDAGSTLMVMTVDGKLRYVHFMTVDDKIEPFALESMISLWTRKSHSKSLVL